LSRVDASRTAAPTEWSVEKFTTETTWVLWLILATTLLRIGFGWALGLGVDESYMVATGRSLQLGYFDHPPVSWWMQWAAVRLLGTDAPLAVRAPFILTFALSTWLMYRLGTAVADRRTGLWAAVALNLSPVFGVTTASWVLPDGPLDCALLGAALCLVKALVPSFTSPAVRERSACVSVPGEGADLPRSTGEVWLNWFGAGLCAGAALLSKYTAFLTIGGAALFLLTSPRHRRWLMRPEPYVAGLVTLAIFSPVLIWNATHGWASFAFQGDRATGWRFRPWESIVVLGGEALFVLPWIWAPMMASAIAALRRGPTDWRSWLLCCLGAPPILLFALVSAWSSQRVLFHWAAPGYLMLFPLLGREIAARTDARWVRTVITGTAVLVLSLVIVIVTQVRLEWLRPVISAVARQDPDVEGINWYSLRSELAARDLLKPGVVVGVPNWRDAGKIAYALGPEATVTVLNTDARQFGFVAPADAFRGRDLLVLAVDNPDRTRRELAPWFSTLEPLPPALIDDNGVQLQTVSVFVGQKLRIP
jgi:4-amino-4-deoxy-L-arabinose transferase-like glycosyltransferase